MRFIEYIATNYKRTLQRTRAEMAVKNRRAFDSSNITPTVRDAAIGGIQQEADESGFNAIKPSDELASGTEAPVSGTKTPSTKAPSYSDDDDDVYISKLSSVPQSAIYTTLNAHDQSSLYQDPDSSDIPLGHTARSTSHFTNSRCSMSTPNTTEHSPIFTLQITFVPLREEKPITSQLAVPQAPNQGDIPPERAFKSTTPSTTPPLPPWQPLHNTSYRQIGGDIMTLYPTPSPAPSSSTDQPPPRPPITDPAIHTFPDPLLNKVPQNQLKAFTAQWQPTVPNILNVFRFQHGEATNHVLYAKIVGKDWTLRLANLRLALNVLNIAILNPGGQPTDKFFDSVKGVDKNGNPTPLRTGDAWCALPPARQALITRAFHGSALDTLLLLVQIFFLEGRPLASYLSACMEAAVRTRTTDILPSLVLADEEQWAHVHDWDADASLFGLLVLMLAARKDAVLDVWAGMVHEGEVQRPSREMMTDNETADLRPVVEALRIKAVERGEEAIVGVDVMDVRFAHLVNAAGEHAIRDAINLSQFLVLAIAPNGMRVWQAGVGDKGNDSLSGHQGIHASGNKKGVLMDWGQVEDFVCHFEAYGAPSVRIFTLLYFNSFHFTSLLVSPLMCASGWVSELEVMSC